MSFRGTPPLERLYTIHGSLDSNGEGPISHIMSAEVANCFPVETFAGLVLLDSWDGWPSF